MLIEYINFLLHYAPLVITIVLLGVFLASFLGGIYSLFLDGNFSFGEVAALFMVGLITFFLGYAVYVLGQ